MKRWDVHIKMIGPMGAHETIYHMTASSAGAAEDMAVSWFIEDHLELLERVVGIETYHVR